MDKETLNKMKSYTFKEAVITRAGLVVWNAINEKDGNEYFDELSEAIIGECIESDIIKDLLVY